MNKPKPSLNLKDSLDKLMVGLRRVQRFSVLIFIVFIVLLYGFVLTRINNLSSAQPSEDAVSSQVKAAKLPHIDQTVVNQLQTLQDNSVNVQTLFSQARNNPFQ
jgi:hypothetical protein